jgi:hypothetical protein
LIGFSHLGSVGPDVTGALQVASRRQQSQPLLEETLSRARLSAPPEPTEHVPIFVATRQGDATTQASFFTTRVRQESDVMLGTLCG